MSKFLNDKKFSYRLVRHLSFFLLVVMTFTLIIIVQRSDNNFYSVFFSVFINALFFFGYAYISIFIIIPELILKNRFFWATILFLLVGIGLSAIKLISSGEIFYSSISPENIENTGFLNLRFIIVNTKDMSFIVALFCIVKYAKDFLYDDKKRRELLLQNKEAQNKLIQSHFNPHFLFNTINNLYALSLLDPGKTDEVIKRIKKVLTYITVESQKKFVDVSNELDLLENYIQLEKLRYGERLKIDFNINGEFTQFKMPPMAFFILVENCFTHGSSSDAGNPWIKLDLILQGESISFKTSNSKSGKGKESSDFERKGVSLTNLEKRLMLLYKSDYSLNVVDTGNEFNVEIKIKKEQSAN